MCTTWLARDRDRYLLEVIRRRLEYPELRRAELHLAREHDASAVLIEDKGSGTHLIQDLKRSGEVFPIACTAARLMRARLHLLTRLDQQTMVDEAKPSRRRRRPPQPTTSPHS